MSRDFVLRRTVLLLMHWLLSTYGWVKVCIQIPISRPLETAINVSKSIDFNLKFMGKINPGFLSNILCKKLALKDLSSHNMNFPKVKMTDLISIRKVRIYVFYLSSYKNHYLFFIGHSHKFRQHSLDIFFNGHSSLMSLLQMLFQSFFAFIFDIRMMAWK